MKIVENYKKFTSTRKSIISIGVFDGVHIGHKKIIDELVTVAKKKDANSVLLTFFPHPKMVLQSDYSIKLINTIDERIELLKMTGLDYLIIHPFDKEFSKLTSFDFVSNVLVNYLKTSKLIIGYDHRFGKDRGGNFEQLRELGNYYNFEVKRTMAKNINNISVSSTKIRNKLYKGAIKKANEFLGYAFTLFGTVVYGRNFGNTLGFPTANIRIAEDYKLIPKRGVYLVSSEIYKKQYLGMMNIGTRPTVKGVEQTIEVHFFNLEKYIYGEKLKIKLLDFLRSEQKFESVENLKKQLLKDKIKSFELIKKI